MALLRVGPLPEGALAAAGRFHAEALPRVAERIAAGPDHLVLAFAPAGQEHRGWRLAALQGLAREHAPLRINAVEGGDARAVEAACAYLARAPGVTGQVLPLAPEGAGAVDLPA